jgi:hypothetical protein
MSRCVTLISPAPDLELTAINLTGIHIGDAQQVDLGDGKGRRNESMIIRENFGALGIGTCLQSLIGGNHFRMYRQDGPKANTGALFLA